MVISSLGKDSSVHPPAAASNLRVADLLQRQRDFFATGATLPLEFRRHALRKLRSALINSEESILAALHADLRKPPREAYAAEIGLVVSEIDYALKHLKAWMKPRRKGVPWMAHPVRARTQAVPLGVALIIGPWNYPVQLLVSPLVGAIAAGNCAIVKPSELAPATAIAIASMISACFPETYIACVQGDRMVAEALLAERFDKVFFTGSPGVGRAVAQAAARHLTPITLELGGKCPVVVCDDANIRIAAKRIVWAKTLNAGQVCVAPDYLLVHASIRSRLIEAMIAQVRNFFGDDVQKSEEFARIVNRRHFDRLAGYLNKSTVISGGRADPADLFIEPSLVEGADLGSPVMQEEIFGPILPIVSFHDISQAIKIIQSRPAPLSAYLFTNKQTTRERFEREIQCGGVCVNDLVVHLFGKEIPFGGVGESGMGQYHGKASFDCFTQHRPTLVCSVKVDLPFRYSAPELPMRLFRKAVSWLLRG